MKLYKRPLLYILLFIIGLAASSAMAGADGARSFKTRLPNGMTVIIEEARAAPVVAMQMWVHVGGADESDAEAGISHVFEHMLFKGTAKRAVGELAREIESVGGGINAYTSFDNTVYHLAVPARHFDTGLDVISDAIQHSSFDPAELTKELEVVLEEIRMNKDRPGRNLFKSILDTAYADHPYRRPVIGYEGTVESFTRPQILAFFKRWYVPANMTLVIVGDIEREAALKAIKESFRNFKGGSAKAPKRKVEGAQEGMRTATLEMDVAEAHFGLAFHIPELKDPDTYAIDVLDGLLGGGASSRLYKKLKIEDATVYSISAYAMTLKDPGLFFITGTARTDNVTAAVSGAIAQIRRLAEEGPNPDELAKVQLNLESSFVYSRETMQGIAGKLGYYDTISGDPGYEDRYIDGIRSVTPEDVRRVIDKYLTEKNLTVSALLPTRDKGSVTAEKLEAAATESYKLAAKETAGADGDAVVTKLKLDNGITLIVKEVHSNPTVALYAAFPGGLRFEKRKKNGVGNFTVSMLARGTRQRSREEIIKEVEEMAGGLSGFSGWNSTGVSGKFLSRHFLRGLELFADITMNPTFPQSEVEKLRVDLRAAIKRRKDNLPRHTFSLFKESLYRVHPYGMPVSGTMKTVNAIKRRDLVKHYRSFFVPERMVLTIVGDVNTAYVISSVKKAFKDFNRKSRRLPTPKIEARATEIRTAGAVNDKAQTHIAIGFLAATIGSPESYPLQVLSEVLSGQGGRLFVNLRDKKSLAYSVSAFFKQAMDPGIFAIYIAVAPEKKDEAIEAILAEFKKISTEEITPAELSRARNSIIGGYEIGLQNVSSQAVNITNNELYGLGFDFEDEYTRKIEAVTAKDVLREAKKFINLKAYTISIVGPNK
jgi:zinc protease